MNFDFPGEMDCWSHLWFAALVQAVEDATLPVAKPIIHRHGPLCRSGCKRLSFTEEHYFQRTAMGWFLHERQDVGSFRWVCSILNLEPERIIEQIKLRRGASRRRASRT